MCASGRGLSTGSSNPPRVQHCPGPPLAGLPGIQLPVILGAMTHVSWTQTPRARPAQEGKEFVKPTVEHGVTVE